MSIAEREQLLKDRFIKVAKECRIAQREYFAAQKKAKNNEPKAMQLQAYCLEAMRKAEGVLYTALTYMLTETLVEVIGTEENNLLDLVSNMLEAQKEWVRKQTDMSKRTAMDYEHRVDSFLGLTETNDPNQQTLF
jgi:hypothetical protein